MGIMGLFFLNYGNYGSILPKLWELQYILPKLWELWIYSVLWGAAGFISPGERLAGGLESFIGFFMAAARFRGLGFRSLGFRGFGLKGFWV